jgi:hypothetical protein
MAIRHVINNASPRGPRIGENRPNAAATAKESLQTWGVVNAG